MRAFLLFLTFALGMTFISCKSQSNTVNKGVDYHYRSGYPEFSSSAFGFIDEKQGPMLEANTDIVKGSLVYSQKGDTLSAQVTVDINIVAINNRQIGISPKRITRQITTNNESITQSRDIEHIPYQVQVPPGNYEITITVQDLNSKKKLTQTTEVYIPETQQGAYTLSDIQLFGKKKEDHQWNQISGYNIPNSIDSLRFVFQVISPQTTTPMKLNSRLVKFKSDTGLPRSITRNNYSSSSIKYKGIDFDRETELQTNTRILSDYKNVFIEYKFANQDRGNYRFEVRATKEDNEEFRGRSFGIKSEHFPTVKSARELARPLYYLMSSGEYEELMKISDADSLKQAIDRFWLKSVGNKRRTQQVIEQYYTRVEEANKRYSNFKEGWKTDRGMIYILFGEPYYERDRLQQLIWYYSYNLQDPERRFFFEQPKLNNKFFPFDHYLLNRNSNYHNIVYNQRGLWLSGRILERQI